MRKSGHTYRYVLLFSYKLLIGSSNLTHTGWHTFPCYYIIKHPLLFLREKQGMKSAFLNTGFPASLILCHFLDLLCKLGNDLIKIAYDTVISYIEDRSVLVLVDGDDDIGLFHSGCVLYST